MAAVLFALAAAACSGAAENPPADGGAGATGRALTIADVEGRLRAEGLEVSRAGDVAQPFLGVAGTLLRVEGAELQVYLYADAAARAADTAPLDRERVAPPTMMVTWVMRPSLVEVENAAIIVLTNDEGLRARLTAALT